MYVFELVFSFSLDKYPVLGLLDRMVVLGFLFVCLFLGFCMLFSRLDGVFFFSSLGLPILDVSCKQDHTLCGLLRLVFFSQHDISKTDSCTSMY